MICIRGNCIELFRRLSKSFATAVLGLLFLPLADAQHQQCTALFDEAYKLVGQSDYRGALAQYRAGSKCYRERNDRFTYLLGLSYQLDCLDKLSAIEESQSLLKTQQQEIRRYASKLTPEQRISLTFSNDLFSAALAKKVGNLDAAIDMYESRLDSIERIADHKQLQGDSLRRAKLLLYLSDAYLAQGNYERANQSAYEAVHIGERIGPLFLDDGTVLKPLVYLAESQFRAGNLEDTWKILGYVDQIIASITSRQSERAMLVAQSIFNIYLQSNNLDSAETYLARLNKIDIGNRYGHEIMHLDAAYQTARGNYVKAEQYYYTCLDNTRRIYGARNETMAQLYYELAHVYLRQGQYQNALISFHEGIYCLAQTSKPPPSPLVNPLPDEMHAQRLMLQLVAGKADALIGIYHLGHDLGYLEAAWHTSRLATHYMKQLRSEYAAESDKALLLDDTYPVFERAIEIASVYHAQSGESHWVDTAYALMEECKALNLRDAILHGEARRYAGIPDSLLQREQALRLEIAGKEQLIRTYRSSPHYDRSIEFSYLNDLANSRDKLHRLITRYEREHPKYYALKHKSITGSIDQIRQVLYPRQTFLEYFVGDSSIYLLVVDRNSQQLFRLSGQHGLHVLIGQHRKSITDFAHDKSQHALTVYAETAHQLYQLLIPEALQPDTALLIVPDGVLGYLSFASLLMTPVQSLTRVSNYDFMVRHHDISYCYSAALYLELLGKSHQAAGPALVCAPDFNTVDATPLEFSLREANRICQLTGGKLLSGPDCTVQAFRQRLAERDYHVLHLATHGSADDAFGDQSYLMFSDRGDSAGTLYARDLYDMHLPMNLVYLSACETASGELRRGEGIISLARSFFYAGAQSLVTTLWRIEDRRAAALSAGFYQELKAGMRKDQAIATAQRHYLRDLKPEDQLDAHPVYWSALIAIGNMNQVAFTSTSRSPWWLITGSLIVFVLLGFLTWRQFKQ